MSTWPFRVMLDRKVCLQGVHAAGVTTWTLPFLDPTINTIVLSNDFGANTGLVIAAKTNNGTLVTADGNWSAGCAMLGRSYQMDVVPSRPFKRGFQGRANATLVFTIRKIATTHRETAAYRTRISLPSRVDRTKDFTPLSGTVLDSNERHKHWATGSSKDMTIHIESATAKPCTVVSLTYNPPDEERPG